MLHLRHNELGSIHEDAVEWVDACLKRKGWAWRDFDAGQLQVPSDELVWYLICEDPVRWVECNLLRRPHDGGNFWRLFGYQKPSLRYRGDVINYSAAEVGKTLEIVALSLYTVAVLVRPVLIVGNQDGTLDEIFGELEYQIERNPWLRQQIGSPKGVIKRKPYRKLSSRNGAFLNTRPTGHDGEPLRGQHIPGLILGDEAPKWHNPLIFDEMFRAAMPGCRVRLYGVPDDRLDSRFEEIARTAIPFEHVGQAEAAGHVFDQDRTAASVWALVHWEKPMRPDWTPELDAEAVRRYGGKTSPGYLRNVLGRKAAPLGAVFPLELVQAALSHIDGYRVLKLAQDDERGLMLAECWESSQGTLNYIGAEELPLDGLDFEDLLSAYLPDLDDVTAAGGDFGYSIDPTELICLRGDRVWSLAGRVQMRRVMYPEQARVIEILEQKIWRPRYGWGFDDMSTGRAVRQQIQRSINTDSIRGYHWLSPSPSFDPETGATLRDEAGKDLVVVYKEWATQILETAFMEGRVRLPYDPDLLAQFPAHRAKKGRGPNRRFDLRNDDTIDAARAAVLAYVEGIGGSALPQMDVGVIGRRLSISLD